MRMRPQHAGTLGANRPVAKRRTFRGAGYDADVQWHGRARLRDTALARPVTGGSAHRASPAHNKKSRRCKATAPGRLCEEGISRCFTPRQTWQRPTLPRLETKY